MAKRPPWKKANPTKKAGKKSKRLSPGQKSRAKASAKKAGRPYPSLVDNMNAAKKKKRKSANKARPSKKLKSPK
jgi:hypothetical protein